MNTSRSAPSCIAEVLGHRQAGQAHAQARSGRLVHLAEHHHGLFQHARFSHFLEKLRAFAGSLAHAAEHRRAAVLLGDVVDKLGDNNRLAHARAAEHADLATLGEGGNQVDDLDARLEHRWLR